MRQGTGNEKVTILYYIQTHIMEQVTKTGEGMI